MKRFFRLAVIILCLVGIFSLFGCKNKKNNPFILDGPGMEYVPPWNTLSVSVSSSIVNDCFYFDVVDTDEKTTVIGSCMDSEGHSYEAEEPFEIPYECLRQLYQLRIEELNNLDEQPQGNVDEDETILDETKVTITIITNDGEFKKQAGESLAKEIYNILLPYFKNSAK